MLTKKDKEWIKKAISDEFHRALFREITINKAPRKAGDKESEIETTTRNMLDVLTVYLPFVEQSLAGVQAASEQSRNRAIETRDKMDSVGNLLTTMTDSISTMARFALVLNNTGLLEQMEQLVLADPERKQIESGSK